MGQNRNEHIWLKIFLMKIRAWFIYRTALEHCWITGKQSVRNIHATVSEQLKKNFAKSRWRVRNYNFPLFIKFSSLEYLIFKLEFVRLNFTGYKLQYEMRRFIIHRLSIFSHLNFLLLLSFSCFSV